MKNSPLTEIIVELRWGPGNPRAPAPFVMGDDEALYLKFGIEVAKANYTQIERTVPAGFPVPGGTVQYRYRNPAGEPNTLYQLGAGVFTTNGLPPYSKWADFLPVVEQGLGALWTAGGGALSGPIWAMVRYVDAFQERHLGGLSTQSFFQEVVGLRYERTQSWLEFGGNNGSKESSRLFVSQQNANGRELQLEVGEGLIKDAPAIIMNTLLVSEPLEAPSVESLVNVLHELQDSAHKLFFEMVDRSPSVLRALRGEG